VLVIPGTLMCRGFVISDCLSSQPDKFKIRFAFIQYHLLLNPKFIFMPVFSALTRLFLWPDAVVKRQRISR